MFQMATGEHPFTVSNEDEFRDDVLTSNYDASRLDAYPRLEIIIENFLKVDPDERWDANMALAFAQEEFVIEIQRLWRGHVARNEFRRRCRALILIQAHIKGFVTKRWYHRTRAHTYESAIVSIQSCWRGIKVRRWYKRIRNAILRCQANALTKQFRKAFLNTKSHVTTCQMFIKRYLAMSWFKTLKNKKQQLEDNLNQISYLINQHNNEADDFKKQFADQKVAKPLEYLGTFEEYEINKIQKGDQTNAPVLEKIVNELERLLQENKTLQNELKRKELDPGKFDKWT